MNDEIELGAMQNRIKIINIICISIVILMILPFIVTPVMNNIKLAQLSKKNIRISFASKHKID